MTSRQVQARRKAAEDCYFVVYFLRDWLKTMTDLGVTDLNRVWNCKQLGRALDYALAPQDRIKKPSHVV